MHIQNIYASRGRKKSADENRHIWVWLNTLRPRQNGRHFADDVFKCIFLNENVWILLKILLKFVPKGPINNIPALVQIMAWRRPGDKPLSEPMMVSLLTHICVARPQWVKHYFDTWELLQESANSSYTFKHFAWEVEKTTTLLKVYTHHT